MTKRLVAVAAVALALSGCTAAEPANTEPESTVDAAAFCETFGDGLVAYTDFIAGIGASLDVDEWRRQMSHVEELETLVPDDARVSLAKFADPAYQIKKVVDAGGGDLTINTNDFKIGVAETAAYCSEL